MTDDPTFGPTGEFPQGKLDDTDKGELALGIAYDPTTNLVRIDFGSPVTWIAMPPEQAIEMAKSLVLHAAQAPRKPPGPLKGPWHEHAARRSAPSIKRQKGRTQNGESLNQSRVHQSD